MYENLFAKLPTSFQSVPESVVRINKLYAASLEKLVNLQISTLHYCADLCIKQLKDVAEISNAEDVQAFLNNQHEIVSQLREKIIENAKAVADLGADFKADLEEATKASVAEVVPKAA